MPIQNLPKFQYSVLDGKWVVVPVVKPGPVAPQPEIPPPPLDDPVEPME